MSKYKKIIACVCIAVSLFSIAAVAGNQGFDLSLSASTGGSGVYSFSSSNPKSDSEQTAYVTVKSTSNGAQAYMSVFNETKTVAYTGEKSVSTVGKYTIGYTKRADKGQKMCLGMKGTSRAVTITGNWNS